MSSTLRRLGRHYHDGEVASRGLYRILPSRSRIQTLAPCPKARREAASAATRKRGAGAKDGTRKIRDREMPMLELEIELQWLKNQESVVEETTIPLYNMDTSGPQEQEQETNGAKNHRR